METREFNIQGIRILEILDEELILNGPQDLLDIVSDYSIKRIVFRKEQITGDFFDLSTGLAGEILQKASNYKLYIGIVGDFENLESKSLRDFIWESNQTRQIVFKKTVKEVLRAFVK